MRYTAASSLDSLPTSRSGKTLAIGVWDRTSLSNAGVSLHPQPPPCESCVSLICVDSRGLFIFPVNYRNVRQNGFDCREAYRFIEEAPGPASGQRACRSERITTVRV